MDSCFMTVRSLLSAKILLTPCVAPNPAVVVFRMTTPVLVLTTMAST